MTFLIYLLTFLLTAVSFFMILLVLIQRGRGGGLAGAFGGMGGQSAFGTRAGDVFTKITIGLAVSWILMAGFLGMIMRGQAKQEATSSSRFSEGENVTKAEEEAAKAKADAEKAKTEADKASAEPAKTEATPAEPAKTEPAPAEPAKSEPVPAEPAPAEPAKAEPAPAEPGKTEAAPAPAEAPAAPAAETPAAPK